MVDQGILLKIVGLKMVEGEAKETVINDRVAMVDLRGAEEVEAEVVRPRQPRDLSRESKGVRLRLRRQARVGDKL